MKTGSRIETNGHTEASPQRVQIAGQVLEDIAHGIDAALVDVAYALRQLRQYGDIRRAVDALERVESVLADQLAAARR